MSAGLFKEKVNNFFNTLCKTEWNATVAGLIVALLSILIMAWWRPWGAVGAIRNWGEWILYGIGLFDKPQSIIVSSGSVIGIGFVAGAFVSACLGNDFSFKFPPPWEFVKAMIAGILMGIGSALAGGCNVGGMYNAIGNLAANGFAMWAGLVIGVVLGLKYIYWEMEHITWGTAGGKNIDFPYILKIIIGLATIAALVWGAYKYSGVTDNNYVASLGGLLLISAGLGYTMQRGRWCMVQAFREPHMTGDCTLAKSVALSILVLAVGAAVLKYAVPERYPAVTVQYNIADAMEDIDTSEIDDEDLADTLDDLADAVNETIIKARSVLNPNAYVRGTFWWGALIGGFLFGLGAMFAGGCGSGTLWRVGEGQMKLWLVVPFFGITNAIMTKWFNGMQLEQTGKLGYYIYLPDKLGYGGTLLLVAVAMAIWYIVVDWNEDSNKLIVEM